MNEETLLAQIEDLHAMAKKESKEFMATVKGQTWNHIGRTTPEYTTWNHKIKPELAEGMRKLHAQRKVKLGDKYTMRELTQEALQLLLEKNGITV